MVSMRNLLLIIGMIVVTGIVLTQVTYIPKAAAEDFGIGVLECAAVVGPTTVDIRVLEANGWKRKESWKKQPIKGAYQYGRYDVGVKLVLIDGQPGCLTGGFPKSDDQFPVIKEALSAALKAKYGSQFEALEPTSPNKQSYRTGNLLHVLSAKHVSDGYEVRVVTIWNQ